MTAAASLLAHPLSAGLTTCHLLGGPLLYLCTEPQLRAAVAEVAHRSRHVGVSVLVDADRIAMSDAEEFGNTVRIQKIVNVHLLSHNMRLLQESDPSEQWARLQ